MEKKENFPLFVSNDDAPRVQQLQDWFNSRYVPTRFPIVQVATSLEETFRAIPRLEKDGIRAAIIDANLRPGVFDGKDGLQVLAAIKSVASRLFVVGYSLDEFPEQDNLRVDVDAASLGLKDLEAVFRKHFIK